MIGVQRALARVEDLRREDPRAVETAEGER
jgi:hypothetical protein